MTHYEECVAESSIEILGHLVDGIEDRHDDLERATLTGKTLGPRNGAEAFLEATRTVAAVVTSPVRLDDKRHMLSRYDQHRSRLFTKYMVGRRLP
jgi:hypothetical protein